MPPTPRTRSVEVVTSPACGFPLPAYRLPRVIPDLALQKLTVREDDLLAGVAADARGFEANVLDFAAVVLHRDRIADDERLVEHDRDRGEQVAEDVLNGERDGDTADSQSSKERLDLDSVGAQSDDREDNPDRETGNRTERLERRNAATIRRMGLNVASQVIPDDDIGPDDAL